MPVSLDMTAELVREAAWDLKESEDRLDPLMEMIGDARFVLLGNSTHGTHEFYRDRSLISKKLIEEKDFSAIAAEADWPDAWRVNQYLLGETDDVDAEASLNGFKRFPAWLWRNADILNFLGWLRDFNDKLPRSEKALIYGLDLYSLRNSIEAVLRYLREIDPEEAKRARSRYSCFEHYGADPHAYAFQATTSQSHSCEEDVIRQLIELRRREEQYTQNRSERDRDDYFSAEQNARLVKNAEHYYRAMFYGGASAWNIRGRHMMETFEAIVSHMDKRNFGTKVIIWAHNSIVGDARATEMKAKGEYNLGQLLREKFGSEVVSIGFTTCQGTVTAASEWDTPSERKRLDDALPESYEALFHECALETFFLNLRDNEHLRNYLADPRLERSIGVIFTPSKDRMNYYGEARLSEQFDAILHFKESRAVEPLERGGTGKNGEIPDTFPFAV